MAADLSRQAGRTEFTRPATPGFEQTAVNWLLEQVPPDYRLHGVLVRHPAALAALARHHLAACVEGARQGYRCARAELGNDLPPGGLAAVLAAYQTEGRRLVAAATATELISRALHGETFVPQLGGTQDPARRAGDNRPPRRARPDPPQTAAPHLQPRSLRPRGQLRDAKLGSRASISVQ